MWVEWSVFFFSFNFEHEIIIISVNYIQLYFAIIVIIFKGFSLIQGFHEDLKISCTGLSFAN